jgi:chromosome segregation ATPase
MKPNRIISIALTATFVTFSLPAAAAPTIAAREADVKARVARTDSLREELGSIDRSIERRIDVIIETLRSIGDSKDSREMVASMKKQSIDALKKTTAYYQKKRVALEDEMRAPTLQLTDEQKREGIEIFAARIEKRMAQVAAIQKSLPGDNDYERYRVELRQSIAQLDKRNRDLKAKKAPAEEIARSEALLAETRKQLAAYLAPTSGATQNVGRSQASDLDWALQTEVAGLRGDFNKLFRVYSGYLEELSALNKARATLKAAS